MNIQALMKQAQQMQKDMTNIKEEIDGMIFTGKNAFVTVKVNGKKEVLNIDFDCDKDTISDSYDMLGDMIMLAINSAFSEVDKVTEEKMGKFANVPGLF